MNLLFFKHIQSVAQYESKMLMRSWFFRIFVVLVLVITIGQNFMVLLNGDWQPWIYKSIPSNIPYLNMLIYNTTQAIIAVFLSSEFLKRDKQLDTSEVFYVRPLSNTEYVFGKIWGNIRVFLGVNLIVLAISLTMNIIASDVSVDIQAYISYFLIISIPTLTFIIGLSIFMMLILKNQALTFVILLGYIGLTLFYIEDKFYYLFDYMAYNLPLFKSTIVGFDNMAVILNHRAIYLFMGLGFIFFTVLLFHRLPNSKRGQQPWLILGLAMVALSIYCGYRHINAFISDEHQREIYTAINNKYVHTPKMTIDYYDIEIEQLPASVSSVVTLKGKALETSDCFTFCLNPGMKVSNIEENGKSLQYERDHQILIVNVGRQLAKGDSITFKIHYKGYIDNNLCNLDIDPKLLKESHSNSMLKIDKKYSFQTKDYLLFTPETYWYPRPGTAYSSISPDWQQSYFSHFKIKVKTLPDLTCISQIEDKPYQAISLIIGRYKQIYTQKDSVQYNLWYIEGNDFFTASLDSIHDTIPGMIKDFKDNVERTYHLNYPFKQLSLIEVPAQFYTYQHVWTNAQEVMQPGMILYPEKGCIFQHCNFKQNSKNQKKWAKRNGRDINEFEARIATFRNFLSSFTNPNGHNKYERGRGNYKMNRTNNPYFIFPQIYNFHYNIYSSEWPITNRLIELYLQEKADEEDWQRNMNGISSYEKACILLEQAPLKDILGNNKNNNLMDYVISLKAFDLFIPAEVKMGVQAFKDSLYTVLDRNSFQNIRFEALLDTMERISNISLKDRIKSWSQTSKLPYYTISDPHITHIRAKSKSYFVLEQIISNDSDVDGYVKINLYGRRGNLDDERNNQRLELKGHQTKKLVSIWDDYINWINVSTLLSKNLPNKLGANPINEGKKRSSIYTKDSCYILNNYIHDLEGELIVDNEDTLLFSLSEPSIVGILPKWLDKIEQEDSESDEFKYKPFSQWRPPLQWTLTTGRDYYGKNIRSAYVIKSGKGGQYARWKIPVIEEGDYDLYFYVIKTNNRRRSREKELTYNFTINYSGDDESAYINLQKAQKGWEKIGSYHFEKDTVTVTLSTNSHQRVVFADAVKIVKQ